MCGVAFAETSTKNVKYKGHAIPLTYEDEYYKPQNDILAGVGLDIKVYEFKEKKFLDSINVEVRKDFINIDRGSIFLTLSLDLTSLTQK